MATAHECLEHVECRQQEFAQNVDCEVDGAIERWTEEWWECPICGERFTDKELKALAGDPF